MSNFSSIELKINFVSKIENKTKKTKFVEKHDCGGEFFGFYLFHCGEEWDIDEGDFDADFPFEREYSFDDYTQAILSLLNRPNTLSGNSIKIVADMKNYLNEKKINLSEYSYIDVYSKVIADARRYNDTNINNLFNGLTINDIDNDINKVAKLYNTDKASLLLYKEHLQKTLGAHSVIINRKYYINSDDIEEKIKIS